LWKNKGKQIRKISTHTVHPPMTSKFLNTEGGGNIHYLDWGDSANKDCILMVHGFNQSCHSWDEFCPRVINKYRVITIDQRGHGLSFQPQNQDYSTDVMADDIYRIAEKLGIAPFILVGMSLGARNSALFTTKYPHMVKSLVLVDWSPEPEADGKAGIERLLKAEWPSFEHAVDTMLLVNPTRTRQIIQDRLKHTLKQLPSGMWTWRVDREAWLKPQSVSVEKQWDMLSKLYTPTLLVKGENSNILSDENAQKVIKTAKNCRLVVVPKAGHTVPGDNPEGFHQVVIEFLQSQQKL